MCGRYTYGATTLPARCLVQYFGVGEEPDFAVPRRYNIAPGQTAACVGLDAEGRRRATMLRWGLVPRWADGPGIGDGDGFPLARSETVEEKPAFRDAFRARRCLVPADGFYEWQVVDGRRRPWFVARADRRPFAFAGIWELWSSPRGDRLESFAVLTAPARGSVAGIHDRMPVILKPEHYDAWLDPGCADPREMHRCFGAFPVGVLSAHRVGPRVNDPEHDDRLCIRPAEPMEIRR